MKTFAPLLLLLMGALLFGCEGSTLVDAVEPSANAPALHDAEALAKVVSPQVHVDQQELFVFQAAGDVGGGVLEPGTVFPPGPDAKSKLFRFEDRVRFKIQTSGLPPGAFTVWIVVANNPEACAGYPAAPCTDVDIFENPDVDAGVFWAAGAVVGPSGHGIFRGTVHEGVLPDGPQQIAWPESGDIPLHDAMKAEIHFIVKYHGPASDDPQVLYDQMYTLIGSCSEGANGVDLGPFGIHCFDPQAAIHRPPARFEAMGVVGAVRRFLQEGR